MKVNFREHLNLFLGNKGKTPIFFREQGNMYPPWRPSALDTKSTHNSNAQLSEKYSPLWKCSKRFIPPQTDGMTCSSFNISCSESKVIFRWRKNNKNNIKKGFADLYKEQTFVPRAFHKQTQSTRPVITEKSPPWACDKGCAEACAERSSALNSQYHVFLGGCELDVLIADDKQNKKTNKRWGENKCVVILTKLLSCFIGYYICIRFGRVTRL